MTAVPPLFLVAQRDNARAETTISLLRNQAFEVLPPVFDGQEALKALALHRPTVAFLGCDLPGLSAVTLLERLTERTLTTGIIVHTRNPDPTVALDAFRLGARGYLPCDAEPDELLACVRAVLRGEMYLSTALLGDVVALTLRLQELEAYRTLSDRQLEILELIAEGLTSEQIAERLHPQVSIDTAESHRRRIREKLGITDTSKNALLKKALAYWKLMGGVKPSDN